MYECHITIDPQFGAERDLVAKVVERYGFKLAKLYMDKGVESPLDTFCTGHNISKSALAEDMTKCCKVLNGYGFKVRRYKIEKIVIDSKYQSDFLGLLG